MTTKDGERIVRVETQIIDLKQDVADVKKNVEKVELATTQIKEMLGEKFMQRTEVQAVVASLKADFAKQQEDIVIQVKALKRRRWYENTASAIAAVAMTFIIQRALGSI